MNDKERALKDMQESMEFQVRRRNHNGDEAVPIVNGGASTEESGTPMDDYEITVRCAMAMGFKIVYPDASSLPICIESSGGAGNYHPLINDVQAMALVKKFGLTCDPAEDVAPFTWRVCVADGGDWENQISSEALDLNRAIVECVAQLQVDRTARETSTVAQDK